MMANMVREEFEKYMAENFDTRLLRQGEGYLGQVVNQMWSLWQKSHRLTQQGFQ